MGFQLGLITDSAHMQDIFSHGRWRGLSPLTSRTPYRRVKSNSLIPLILRRYKKSGFLDAEACGRQNLAIEEPST